MQTLTPKITLPIAADQLQFYEFYFELQNIGQSSVMRLSKQEITLAAIICTYDYVLHTNKAQHGQSQKYLLAEDLRRVYPDFQTSAIYGILGNLKRKKILVEKDRFLVLHDNIRAIKDTVNSYLDTDGHFEFTYAIDFSIDKGNLPASATQVERAGH